MAFFPTRQPGISGINMVLILVVAVILAFSGYAVYQSFSLQQRIATAFEGWHEGSMGYAKAVEEQQSSKKPMIVYFYAPWCPHCKRFTQELLSTDEVKSFLKDYPRVKIYPEENTPELTLMANYGATGFPTFFVVRPDGQRIRVSHHSEKAGPGGSRLKTPQEFIQSIKDAARTAK